MPSKTTKKVSSPSPLVTCFYSTSNWSHVSFPLIKESGWDSMATINFIIVTKTLDNNQWPLDWFSAHVGTTKFEHVVTISHLGFQDSLVQTQCFRFAALNSKVSSKFIAFLVNLIWWEYLASKVPTHYPCMPSLTPTSLSPISWSM
jgi:hypothetical protein